MFEKIKKNFQNQENKQKEEIQIRLTAIVNELGEILQRRSVNFYEMADILVELQARFMKNVFEGFQKAQDINKKLKQENDDLSRQQKIG